jgi:hypothetical protein
MKGIFIKILLLSKLNILKYSLCFGRYEVVKKIQIEKYEKIRRFAITTDGWQRKYTAQKYETVTAHYRDENGRLCSDVLDTLIFKVKFNFLQTTTWSKFIRSKNI